MQQLFVIGAIIPSLYPHANRVITYSLRTYSTQRPGFFAQVLKNIKHEFEKNRDMKENVKKFREEAQKLEQSDALKAARQKFNAVESEASKSGELLKENLDNVRGRMTEALGEAAKTGAARKVGQLGEELRKTARVVGETLATKGQALGQSGAFQGISKAAKMVRDEMDSQSIESRVYRSPEKLRKRVEVSSAIDSARVLEPNTKATELELHKDSKFYQAWEQFKNNNQYVNTLLTWKMKYDQSANPMIRASRLLTDQVSEVIGNLFSKTELSETLTEICKIDPSFDQKQFLLFCETDIIPNVLESMVRGDLEIMRDWCFDSTFSVLASSIFQVQQAGYRLDSKILDIENVELTMGKVMEQGPVLIVSFQTQQIMCVRDSKGVVIEGDPEKVMRCHYMWVLCRDPNELNPKAAWRLMEMSVSSRDQFV